MTAIICQEIRKARKPHRCIWCGEDIVPGERYTYVRGVFEGEPFSNHWHPPCDAEAGKPEYRDDIEGGFEPYSYPRAAPSASDEARKP